MAWDWSGLAPVVVGAALAVGAGWLQSRWARRDQDERFKAEQQAIREREVRERADQKAELIVSTLNELSRLYFNPRSYSPYLAPDGPEERAAVRDLLARIELASMYLPGPVRKNVAVATRLLPILDEMHGRGFMRDEPRVAGRVVIQHATKCLARYLRGDEQLERSDTIEGYDRALQDFDGYVEYEIARQVSEAERHRAAAVNGEDGTQEAKPAE